MSNTSNDEELEKSIGKRLLSAAALAGGLAAGSYFTTPSSAPLGPSPEKIEAPDLRVLPELDPPSTQPAESPQIGLESQLEAKKPIRGKIPDYGYDFTGYNEELFPIAYQESMFGRYMDHQPHSKGPFDTAFGPLGIKPSTAIEQYRRSKDIQQRYPGLDTNEKFMKEFHSNPDLYRDIANAFWDFLKQRAKGDLGRAAYGWRVGQGAALRHPDERVKNYYYTKAYNKLWNQYLSGEEMDLNKVAKSEDSWDEWGPQWGDFDYDYEGRGEEVPWWVQYHRSQPPFEPRVPPTFELPNGYALHYGENEGGPYIQVTAPNNGPVVGTLELVPRYYVPEGYEEADRDERPLRLDQYPYHYAVFSVGVHPEHQRQGLATAMYDFARLRTGKEILPGGIFTPEGRRFRERYDTRPAPTPETLGKSENDVFTQFEDFSDRDFEDAIKTFGGRLGSDYVFEAARMLAGAEPVSSQRRRQAQVLFEDPEAAALYAYELPDSPDIRRALKGLLSGISLSKAGEGIRVTPGTSTARDLAKQIEEAFNAGRYKDVDIGGKSSAGSQMVKTLDGTPYLIKYDTGELSPAQGVDEEDASQPQREAAFFQLVKYFGLADNVPRTELMQINGRQAAVIGVLRGYSSSEEVRQQQGIDLLAEFFHPYLENGRIHQWAATDYLLGNPDRHGGNILIGPNDEIALIDHGSAFAGRSFNPALDPYSFIPFYLRVFRYDGFMTASPAEKLRRMPSLSKGTDAIVAAWVNNIQEGPIAQICDEYQIDPTAIIERLRRLKAAPFKSHFLNRFFAGVPVY